MFKFTTKGKILIYLVTYLSMTIFPIIAFYIGWIGWDIHTGVNAALVTFMFWLVSGSAVFYMMADIPLAPATLPFLLGLMYPFLPDYIPGSVDAAMVVAVGAILTFILWKRRKPATPPWLLAPMLLTAIYTLFGAIIPTLIDEAVVYILLVSLTIFGLVTRLAFHTLYIHLFSIIVFLSDRFKKITIKLGRVIVKRVPSKSTLEATDPLNLAEMEVLANLPDNPGVSQPQGLQV